MSSFVDGSSTVGAEAVGLSQRVPAVSAVPISHGSSVPIVTMMPAEASRIHPKVHSSEYLEEKLSEVRSLRSVRSNVLPINMIGRRVDTRNEPEKNRR